MMIPVILQESGTAAEAKVIAHYRNHQAKTGTGNMIWIETETDSGIETEIEPMILKVTGGGIGTGRRVVVGREMTMIEIEAEKETGIGEEE